MKVQYLGLEHINGPLVYLKTPRDISYNEQVELVLKSGEKRIGNVIAVDEDVTVIQVYEGTDGLNIEGVKTELKGKALQVKLSEKVLGRIFNGIGEPIDGLGELES